MNDSNFSEMIYTYTRAMALQDGALIDVTTTAKEAGITVPVALTQAVNGRYVKFNERAKGQDEAGRLWDVLWMFRYAVHSGAAGLAQVAFKLFVAIPADVPFLRNERRLNDDDDLNPLTHREVTLKALIGPGDQREPVITIMLPCED